MNCTKCGAPLTSGARFCTVCGAPAAAAVSRPENRPEMDLSEFFEKPAAGRGERTAPRPRERSDAPAARTAAPARRPVREAEAKPRKSDRGLNIALLICGVLAIAVITFVLILWLTGSKDEDGGQNPQGGTSVATASPQPVVIPPAPTSSAPTADPTGPSPTTAPVVIITPTPLPSAAPATPAPPTPAPPTPAPTKDPDYLLPDSNSRYLTEDDLKGLTHEQLCFARNEIYARHGRIFKTPEIANYFNSKPWYKGTVAPDKFSDSVFNSYEKYNISFISNYEKKYYGGSYY